MEPGNPSSVKLNALELTRRLPNVHNTNKMEDKQGICSCSPVKEKVDGLKVLIIKFQSIRNKKEELEIQLLDNSIDIVLGSETHLNVDICDNGFIRPAYKCYRRDRADGFGGSISITRNNLVVEKIVASEICEFLAVKIQTNRQPIIVATAYRSPRSTLVNAANISKELTMLHKKYKTNPIWFGG